MARIFIVVAQDREDLYDYFRKAFADVPGVELTLDRRLPQVNVAPAPVTAGAERRMTEDVYDELWARGFVIVRLPQ